MDDIARQSLYQAIISDPQCSKVIEKIDSPDNSGRICYNREIIRIDSKAPGFVNGCSALTDEELVRAYLICRLGSKYAYPISKRILDIERSYKTVGRKVEGKGGRVDLLLRQPHDNPFGGIPFLFIECKAPKKYDNDLREIDGQLFRLSRLEEPIPRYLVYFTAEPRSGKIFERVILVDTNTFKTFDAWDKAGQPIFDTIPKSYGYAARRPFANVSVETEAQRPLDSGANREILNRIKSEIHDVIWGGGGTNNNEVFACITRLVLCKIFDEKETNLGEDYSFQRFGTAEIPESSEELVGRLNQLYKQAEDAYLALPTPIEGPAFDSARISSEKLAYVVGRIEGISLTENDYPGDLLGEFFEQIVAQDFTQTKGQFFTPMKIVQFMLSLACIEQRAYDFLSNERDSLGRPRLPFVIDPSCGSGTFLIEYMKRVTKSLASSAKVSDLSRRVQEYHQYWFGTGSGNSWAKDHLFGIESNYDLGISAKVNMVLHGDGSMNTWIKSGLLPFDQYSIQARHSLLSQTLNSSYPGYAQTLNEQFDVVFSNPPFSVKLSKEEKKVLSATFKHKSPIETTFLERWFQLLREDGIFCCILPEAILDTSSNKSIRLFLLKHFQILSVVSLPYDAFRPFTSTKTSIVLARKRKTVEVAEWESAYSALGPSANKLKEVDLFKAVSEMVSWANAPIFMAEPASIGYKRRRNLPDIDTLNELVREPGNSGVEPTVLETYRKGEGAFAPNRQRGFWTNLAKVYSRSGCRLDPKYRWFWDFQDGIAYGAADQAEVLSSVLEISNLPKFNKGELGREYELLDLESVESRQAIVSEFVPKVEEINSDKVHFSNCELAISKLEPYLGKVLISPDEEQIGSTEWVGLSRKTEIQIPIEILAYLLMLPDMCEAYRCLQSGKRHARFDPTEFLSVRLQLPPECDWDQLTKKILDKRSEIRELREKEKIIRLEIDSLL